MNGQAVAWAGSFGTQYTQRNRVAWRSRAVFWREIIEGTQARSVLEVGCNAGWNLTAIRSVAPWVGLRGVDVNRPALEEARAAGFDARLMEAGAVGSQWPSRFELTFTAGVLIHVPPQHLSGAMESIARTCSRFVLAIEYAAPAEEEVRYRGQEAMLWKRPFGELYKGIGLALVGSGQLRKVDGFDDCTWWLMEKPVSAAPKAPEVFESVGRS